MKKHVIVLSWLCIFWSFINFLWLGYDYYLFTQVELWFKNPSYYEPFLKLIDGSLVSTFFSHLVIFMTIIMIMKHVINYRVAASALLVYGLLSFILVYGHFACLHDIINEYEDGFAFGEIRGGKNIQLYQMVFYLGALVYFIAINRFGKSVPTLESKLVERLFFAHNSFGVICGIAGMFMVWMYSTIGRPIYNFELLPFAFILLPYLITLTGWQMRIVKDKKTGWDDEKQKADVRKAAALTLVVSLVVLISAYIVYFHKVTGHVSLLWLPFYIFLVLLVFSGTALYNFIRN